MPAGVSAVQEAAEPAEESRPVSSGRLLAVDALRGVAILAVLCYHVSHNTTEAWGTVVFYPRFLSEMGLLGVPLFLVISGFCIHLALARRMADGAAVRTEWGSFWRRRFHRLYPPYVVAILLGLLLKAPSKLPHFGLDLGTHLLMVHNLFPAFEYGLGNAALWSLGLEEQLYGLYAAYVVWRRRVSAIRIAGWVMALTLCWRIATVFAPQQLGTSVFAPGDWKRWPFASWEAWILGALAAEAFTGRTPLPDWCFRRRWALGFGAAGFLLSAQFPKYLSRAASFRELVSPGVFARVAAFDRIVSEPLFVVSFFVLLNWWVKRERDGVPAGMATRTLASVGVISYSLYLTHLPLYRAMNGIVKGPLTVWNLAFRYALLMPASLAVGALFYFLVERHFLNRRSSRTRGDVLAGDRKIAR